MSVTMATADGVTVLTLTADPQSPCPPLCQVLKGLCYSRACCSVSQHLRRVQRTSQSVLGTLHIMVGLLNIGLGMILYISLVGSWREMDYTWFPIWLGGLFMFFGIMNILSEKYPSQCLVIINMILNVAGLAFAITAIVLYSVNLSATWKGLWWWWWGSRCDDYCSRHDMPRPSLREEIMKKKCLESEALTVMLSRSINAVLIVLSVLELCVAISSAVMGIKALRSREKEDNKSNDDPEHYTTLLEEVTNNPKE